MDKYLKQMQNFNPLSDSGVNKSAVILQETIELPSRTQHIESEMNSNVEKDETKGTIDYMAPAKVLVKRYRLKK